MILIFSTPNDYDTNCVIDWLNEKGVSFFRLNDQHLMEGIVTFSYNPSIEEDSYLKTEQNKIYIKNISTVWFRKFGFLNNYEDKIGKNNDLLNYLKLEFKIINNLLIRLLNNKKWLFKVADVKSKLEVLNQAKKSGLEIPKTIITTCKNDLINFYNSNNKNIITKSIGEAKLVNFDNENYMFHTHKVFDIESLYENFSPSLFQEYIEKKFELRVFYQNGKCYSMAIFSQSNLRTKIDFRDYDVDFPNRFVPYKLPNEISDNIKKLMKILKLNTGSIDLLLSRNDGKYYFLEVNPAGQFGMVSFPCNYNLHLKVAEYLIKLNNE